MHNRPTIFIFEIETGGLCKNRLQIHSGEAANAGTAIDADPVLRVIIGAIAIVPHCPPLTSSPPPGSDHDDL